MIGVCMSEKEKKKGDPVYFAERVRRKGAKDTGERGEEIFKGGNAKYEKTEPKVERSAVEKQFDTLLMRRGSVADQYLGNLPVGADEFVAEQRANYERDDPDGYYADEKKRKNSLFGIKEERPDKLIDFDKRESKVLVYPGFRDDVQVSEDASAYYAPHSDTIHGVGYNEIESEKRSREINEEFGKKHPSEKKEEYSKLVFHRPAHRYSGKTEDSAMDFLNHELVHSYTSGGEVGTQAPVGDVEKYGSYTTANNAEYTRSVVTGLNSMRDISGMKLNDPQSVHQLFDELEKNPKLMDKVSPEGGRLFRSYFHLKENNPWAAEKLREAVARDSKYLAENEVNKKQRIEGSFKWADLMNQERQAAAQMEMARVEEPDYRAEASRIAGMIRQQRGLT